MKRTKRGKCRGVVNKPILNNRPGNRAIKKQLTRKASGKSK